MITLFSPAKINLFLRILDKRSDGYHEIGSLFQALDLCDSLNFSFSDRDELTCTDSKLAVDDSNLVIKAVNLFRKKTGLNFGIKIHLIKNIPMGGGLGGGSSNAATTLWGLNELCDRPLSFEELLLLGGELGSDVPFFFSEGTAYCTGRGEIVKFLPPLLPQKLWLVCPNYGISTVEVYKKFSCKEKSTIPPEVLLDMFLSCHAIYINDLEKPAFILMPELALLKKKLQSQGFKVVMMSGSGTSFFCIGGDSSPKDDDFSCFRVNFLRRQSNSWYKKG